MVNNISDVIVLIRDPRAIAVSRLELESIRPGQDRMDEEQKHKYLLSSARECCDKFGDIVTFFKQQPRDGALYRNVSARLSIVRFEDIAFTPIEIARKVYARLDLNMPESVSQWLSNATRGESTADGFMGKYLTKRDSRAVTDKWRKKLTFDTVTHMQDMCPETYDYLGYTRVTSETQLLAESEGVVSTPHSSLDLLIS